MPPALGAQSQLLDHLEIPSLNILIPDFVVLPVHILSLSYKAVRTIPPEHSVRAGAGEILRTPAQDDTPQAG